MRIAADHFFFTRLFDTIQVLIESINRQQFCVRKSRFTDRLECEPSLHTHDQAHTDCSVSDDYPINRAKPILYDATIEFGRGHIRIHMYRLLRPPFILQYVNHIGKAQNWNPWPLVPPHTDTTLSCFRRLGLYNARVSPVISPCSCSFSLTRLWL